MTETNKLLDLAQTEAITELTNVIDNEDVGPNTKSYALEWRDQITRGDKLTADRYFVAAILRDHDFDIADVVAYIVLRDLL